MWLDVTPGSICFSEAVCGQQQDKDDAGAESGN